MLQSASRTEQTRSCRKTDEGPLVENTEILNLRCFISGENLLTKRDLIIIKNNKTIVKNI